MQIPSWPWNSRLASLKDFCGLEKIVIVYPFESCEGFSKQSNTFLVDVEIIIIVANNAMLENMHSCYVHVSYHKTI